MKLGNSGANNKGKKYLKIKEGAVATPENEAKAERFALWFGQWYTRLQMELKRKDTYDEDMMNDTFIRIYDKIRFGGIDILDYKAYFHRAFFTNFMQRVISESQGSEVALSGYDMADDTDTDEELIRYKLSLENDIFDYIYNKYPVHQFELFKMYVRLKPAINYTELAKITEVSVSTISDVISKIRRDVCRQHDFRERRSYTLRSCER